MVLTDKQQDQIAPAVLALAIASRIFDNVTGTAGLVVLIVAVFLVKDKSPLWQWTLYALLLGLPPPVEVVLPVVYLPTDPGVLVLYVLRLVTGIGGLAAVVAKQHMLVPSSEIRGPNWIHWAALFLVHVLSDDPGLNQFVLLCIPAKDAVSELSSVLPRFVQSKNITIAHNASVGGFVSQLSKERRAHGRVSVHLGGSGGEGRESHVIMRTICALASGVELQGEPRIEILLDSVPLGQGSPALVAAPRTPGSDSEAPSKAHVPFEHSLEETCKKSDEMYERMEILDAFEFMKRAARDKTLRHQVEFVWRAARASFARAYIMPNTPEETYTDEKTRMFKRAHEWSARAFKMAPENLDCIVWHYSTLGCIVHTMDTNEQTETAHAIVENGNKILDQDPNNIVALTMLANWHEKVSKISTIARMGAAAITKRGVPKASITTAEELFLRAYDHEKCNPDVAIRLGKVYEAQRRKADAAYMFKMCADQGVEYEEERAFIEVARRSFERVKAAYDKDHPPPVEFRPFPHRKLRKKA